MVSPTPLLLLLTLLLLKAPLTHTTSIAPPTHVLSAMVVAVASDATAPEKEAAAELAAMVGQLCGMPSALPITTPTAAKGKPQLAVGIGAATALGIEPGDVAFSVLGAEGFVASSNRSSHLRETGSYALSGASNSTVGTLYACYHLLRAFGVRFLAWDHTLLPASAPSPLPPLDRTFVPTFEYRDVDGWSALSHPKQASYFHMNGAAQASSSSSSSSSSSANSRVVATTTRVPVPGASSSSIAAPPHSATSMGSDGDSRSPYASPTGFVHTSYALFDGDTNGKFNCTGGHCPPEDMFKKHNEW